ncbi:mediator of RNA polymerase II transcription subunit 20-like [Oscarella lobularis]|uniref:mediator of RNA polymerase II transcription subunit 20-like n=1 Tax=Oscarella lobularis TaxID=121494 RepID=UPI0033138176
MYIVRVSEYPHSTFVILDAGPCIVADSSIVRIIDRLASFYQPKASNASQVKGYKYRLGDYAIRIGIATIGQSVKGVLIEIEALPFVDPSICWKSLTEFIGRLVDGSLVLPAVAPVPRSSDKQYSPLDTAMQYVSVFDEMRSAKTV